MTDNNSGSPHTNAFLKNLSQKKYSWMEDAAIVPPIVITNISPSNSSTELTPTTRKTNITTSSPKKSKKQRVSPEPDIPSSSSSSPTTKKHKSTIKPHKASSPPTLVNNHSEDHPSERKPTLTENKEIKTTLDAIKVEKKMPIETKPRMPQPLFKYTTFPVKGYNILPTRNITSTFTRNDVTYFSGNKAGSEEISPNPEEEFRDTIIIHPGSRNLRIGIASEAFPISVPHVIARRFNSSSNNNDVSEMDILTESGEEKRAKALNKIKAELKWRMKNAKRRAVPNAEAQVVSFNTNAFKETILDHNDPYKVEWTENKSGAEHFVGEKAINLPIGKDSKYKICHPWKYGTLNSEDYTSMNAVLCDLETIWTETIANELEIEKADFKNYNVVLVVPDLLKHGYLCELVTMLLKCMSFRGVIIVQESTCATYGAGVSSAVVVDIGAQNTSITCIEDGVCQSDSRVSIALGGDDITKTFTLFLLDNKFPYSDIDLSTTFGWRMAEELKEKWCTMNEADISVQVYDFFARTPFKSTLKYQCKVYDEVFLAPLCLVYPGVLQSKKRKLSSYWANKYVTDDVVEDLSTTTKHNQKQQYSSYPIDIAIAQSIVNAANGSEEKLKRYFTSIILVGGGGKIANFSRVLEDRVLSTELAQKNFINQVEVLPAPRELDPEVLVWKGASVMGKLDIAKDMWIGPKEWNEVGAKCLRERALLM